MLALTLVLLLAHAALVIGLLVLRHGLVVGRVPVMSENCRLRRIRDGVWIYQCQDE